MKQFLIVTAGAFVGTVSAHIIMVGSAMVAASALYNISEKVDIERAADTKKTQRE